MQFHRKTYTFFSQSEQKATVAVFAAGTRRGVRLLFLFSVPGRKRTSACSTLQLSMLDLNRAGAGHWFACSHDPLGAASFVGKFVRFFNPIGGPRGELIGKMEEAAQLRSHRPPAQRRSALSLCW